MPRYIDAELLEKKLFPLGMIADGQYAINAKAVKVAIDSIPTADVVEVVRCKDCIYCDLDGRCEAPENGLTREFVKPDDFCSYGERSKENAKA